MNRISSSRLYLAAAAAAATIVMVPAPPAASDLGDTVVRIDSGLLRGEAERLAGVELRRFSGVPYTAAHLPRWAPMRRR